MLRKSNQYLPRLKESERKFFHLVSAGDVNAVKEFLQQTPGLNINSVDFKVSTDEWSIARKPNFRNRAA